MNTESTAPDATAGDGWQAPPHAAARPARGATIAVKRARLRGVGTRALFAMLALATLQACTTAPPAAPPPLPVQDVLLRYQQSQHLDAAARAARVAAVRQRIGLEPSLVNRVELALLMSMPDASGADRIAARELLLPCAGDPTTDALVGLCVLAGRMLGNDAELRGQIAAVDQQLREATARAELQQQQITNLTAQSAAKQETEARRIASLERRLGDQHKQIDALRRQMRELQAIERSIEDRHGSGGP